RSQEELLEEILELVRGQAQQLAVLNPVVLMGLSTSARELAQMNTRELRMHYNKLMNLYASGSTASEQYIVQLELNRINDELQRRSGPVASPSPSASPSDGPDRSA